MSDEQADSRDERIGRVLNEYLDRKQRGEPVDAEDLLAAHPDLADELRDHFGMVQQVSTAVSSGGAGTTVVAPPPESLPGYDIQGEIHRGGQGVVYQALQKATRRQVAIKVMREGPFGGWRDHARFEREVQVLAALNHPGIVTIHDSGTAAGSHYFVMDYIAGSPLDVWADIAPRSVEQILRLFLTVCEAVNAAHIKGIIHRDLKPGNIRIDDEGRPHILDFGLAKRATHDDEDLDARGMTAIGQFVGSLPWTSPEQAQGTVELVDTRTDVYALGVILYQLLTGTFPYDVKGPMRDVLNRIVSDEPKRPASLRKEIDRDVEAIVLKCLRKEPHRRYQTAGELSRDIERYLVGDAVAARSDSGLYVFGKMLRRHRVPVAVTAAFALLITVSLLASLSLWRQAVADRDRAIAARREREIERDRADRQALEAEQARILADRERARAQAQAEQLRRATYLNRIALARNAYEQKDLTLAQRLLEACPSDLRGWEWYHLSRLARQPALLNVAADPNCVVALTMSPDGEQVVSGGCDGVIRIWHSATGAAVTELKGHADKINTLAFSPDGRWIASGSRDGTLRLWDIADGSHRILEEGQVAVNGVAFSPDGTRLVAGGASRVLTFHEVPSGRLLRTSAVHGKDISCVAWSPDGRRVASGEFLNPIGGNCRVRMWDADTGENLWAFAGHSGAVLAVAFSPDGRRVASSSGVSSSDRDALGTLRIFDSRSGLELLSLRGHEGFVEALAFGPDGRRLASAGAPRTPGSGTESDRTLKVWDTATGATLSTYSAHHRGGRAVVWSPDGDRIFSGGMDGRLKAWPTSPPPEARVLRGHAGPVLRIALSPDGKQLASSSGQGESDRPGTGGVANTVRLWDLETDSPVFVLADHESAVLGLDWSPDGKYIASGSADRTIRVYHRDGTSRFVFDQLDGIVHSVAFSPDGGLLAGAAGNSATVWNVADGSEARRIRYPESPLTVTFSPDGRWLATSLPGGDIRVLDRTAESGSHVISTGLGLNGAWFSPDSTTIASAHVNGTILLWDAASGAQVSTMRGPQRSVEWLDFSPDGRRIASCTSDMMLKLWDATSASEVYTTRAHDAPVMCVRFSPDGREILTCGQDTLIKIWGTSSTPPEQ